MKLPVSTLALVSANVAAYAAGLSIEVFGLVPAHADLMSIVTSMFIHANLVHLIGNTIFLLGLGTIVETELGHARFLALYLAAGVGGGLVHVMVNTASTDVLVGASGAVCGLLAVAAVLRPRLLLGLAAGFVLMNVWYAFAGAGGVVSFGAHIGGFVVGSMFVVMLALANVHTRWVEAV
jgi:membrane associated rhomboid family serine protease